MLDPAGEKCDLHIRAAGIFLMQLELLKAQRLIAFCHNEGANVDEDRCLATARATAALSFVCDISLALSVVPETQPRSRASDPGSAKNHD